MTIVKVAGIEMLAVLRAPNGAECDVCGKCVNFDRKEWLKMREQLTADGWRMGGLPGEPCRCPVHANQPSSTETT